MWLSRRPLRRLATDLGNRTTVTNLPRQCVGDFATARHRFHLAGARGYPERMTRSFPLERAAMVATMA